VRDDTTPPLCPAVVSKGRAGKDAATALGLAGPSAARASPAAIR